jgi:hypothetical protein
MAAAAYVGQVPAALCDYGHHVWRDAEAARQYMLAHGVPGQYVDLRGVYLPAAPLVLRNRAVASWAAWQGVMAGVHPDWAKLAEMGVTHEGSESLESARWRSGSPWMGQELHPWR